MLENRLEELEKGLRKLMGLPAIQDAIKAHEEEQAAANEKAQAEAQKPDDKSEPETGEEESPEESGKKSPGWVRPEA